MGPSNWVTLLSPAVAGGAVLQSDLSSVPRDFVPEEWPGHGLGLLCSQAVGRSYSSPARTPQMQEGQGGCGVTRCLSQPPVGEDLHASCHREVCQRDQSSRVLFFGDFL